MVSDLPCALPHCTHAAVLHGQLQCCRQQCGRWTSLRRSCPGSQSTNVWIHLCRYRPWLCCHLGGKQGCFSLQFWGSGSLQNPASHRSWRFSSLPLAMCPQSLLVFHDWRFWRILASYLMPRPSFWVSLMFFHDQVEAVHVGEGCHRDRPLWGVVCGVHDVRTCCRRSESLSWGRTGVSWDSRWWSYWFLGNN